MRTGAPPPRTPTVRKNICATGSSTPCGTPTKPTIEPARAMSIAVRIDCPVPTHSSAASTPTPPVIAVADHRDGLAPLDPRADGRVMAGGEDVGEREQRAQHLVGVAGSRHPDECA